MRLTRISEVLARRGDKRHTWTGAGGRRARLEREPPVTPIGMGKATRGVELASVGELDERQVAAWMTQAAGRPFLGASQRAKKKAAGAPAQKPR